MITQQADRRSNEQLMTDLDGPGVRVTTLAGGRKDSKNISDLVYLGDVPKPTDC